MSEGKNKMIRLPLEGASALELFAFRLSQDGRKVYEADIVREAIDDWIEKHTRKRPCGTERGALIPSNNGWARALERRYVSLRARDCENDIDELLRTLNDQAVAAKAPRAGRGGRRKQASQSPLQAKLRELQQRGKQ